MGSLDPAKILIILLVALIVLGPERLPRAARQLGAMWHELSKLRDKVEGEVRSAIPDLDLPAIPKMPRGGVTGYLTGMMTSASSRPRTATRAGASPSQRAGSGPTGDDPPGPIEAGATTPIPWQPAGGSGWDAGAGLPGLPEGVPAGWASVGAPAPGYASGSLLSPVPVGTSLGPIDAEASLTFDEPSWN